MTKKYRVLILGYREMGHTMVTQHNLFDTADYPLFQII